MYEFGPFRLDPTNRELTREGAAVTLPPRAFDTLVVLVRAQGQLVSKNDLLTQVWKDSIVEESSLTMAISVLRKALGDEEAKRRYIATVAKSGYRFIGEVRVLGEIPEPQPAPVVPPAITPEITNASRTLPAWTGWLLLLLFILPVSFIFWKQRNPSTESVAVLPFRNLSGDAAKDYLGIGITDALITRLSGEKALIIRPTSAVMKYTSSALDPVAAGKEQGVDMVLDGKVQTSDTLIRITVQILRVSDGSTIWSGKFEQSPSQMFLLQDAAAESIAGAVLNSIGRSEDRKKSAPPVTASSKAYDFYMRGRYFWNRRTEENLRRGIDYFQKAIAEDPNYALAHAGLADSYALMASFSAEPGQKTEPAAKAAALRAIELDKTLAEPHASLGMLSFFTDWNGPAAEREFRNAIVLKPNYATAHHWYALDLAAMGRLSESLAEIHRAEELDPLSLIISTNVGWVLYFNRRYDEAIVQYRKALELDPHFARARTRLGIAYLAKHETAAGIRELETAVGDSGDDPYISGVLGGAKAMAGDRQGAQAILRELTARSASHYVPPFAFALVYVGLADKDNALQWLEKATADHSTSMVYAKVDPSLDPLRNDVRFQAILSRMNF